MRPLISSADWVRAIAALREGGSVSAADEVVVAELLGLELRSNRPVGPVQEITIVPSARSRPAVDPASAASKAELASLPLRENEVWLSEPTAPPSVQPPSWASGPDDLGELVDAPNPAPASLFEPKRQRAVILGAISRSALEGELDLERLVAEFARDGLVAKLPRKARRRVADGVEVLLDLSARMQLFSADQVELLEVVKRQVAAGALRVRCFREHPERGVSDEDDLELGEYSPPPRGSATVLVTNFAGASIAAWSAFAAGLERAGVSLVAVTPMELSAVAPALLRAMSVVSWDRGTSVRDVERARAKKYRAAASVGRAEIGVGVEDLARAVSISPRISPAWIREVRTSLFPGASVSLESKLWWSACVRHRAPTDIVFDARVTERFRGELAGREIYAELRALLRRTRKDVEEGKVDLEELERELVIAALEGDAARIEARWEAVVRAFRAGRIGLAGWTVGIWDHLPEGAKSRAARVMLALAYAHAFKEPRAVPAETWARMSAEERALLDQVPAVEVGVRYKDGELTISDPPERGDELVAAFATEPRGLTVVGPATRWSEEGASVAQRRVFEHASGRPLRIELPIAVRGARGEHRVERRAEVMRAWEHRARTAIAWVLDRERRRVAPGFLFSERGGHGSVVSSVPFGTKIALVAIAGREVEATVVDSIVLEEGERIQLLRISFGPSEVHPRDQALAKDACAIGLSATGERWGHFSVPDSYSLVREVPLSRVFSRNRYLRLDLAQFLGSPLFSVERGELIGVLVQSRDHLSCVGHLALEYLFWGGPEFLERAVIQSDLEAWAEGEPFAFRKELLVLEEMLLAEEPRLIALAGPEGIGKTGLLRRWLARYRARNAYRFNRALIFSQPVEGGVQELAARAEHFFEGARPGERLLVLDARFGLDDIRFLYEATHATCVFTTELVPPAELGASTIELAPIHPAAGAALLSELGAEGTARELERASVARGGHLASLVFASRRWSELLARGLPADVQRDDDVLESLRKGELPAIVRPSSAFAHQLGVSTLINLGDLERAESELEGPGADLSFERAQINLLRGVPFEWSTTPLLPELVVEAMRGAHAELAGDRDRATRFFANYRGSSTDPIEAATYRGLHALLLYLDWLITTEHYTEAKAHLIAHRTAPNHWPLDQALFDILEAKIALREARHLRAGRLTDRPLTLDYLPTQYRIEALIIRAESARRDLDLDRAHEAITEALDLAKRAGMRPLQHLAERTHRALLDQLRTPGGLDPIHILHLSDLHLDDRRDPAELLAPLRRTLAEKRINYLVVSGDLTLTAAPSEFQRAYEFLDQLTRDLRISRECCLIVPGNHDMRRSGESPRSKAFADFYASFFHDDYPVDPAEQVDVHSIPRDRLQFLLLNSARDAEPESPQHKAIHLGALKRGLDRIEHDRRTWLDPAEPVLRIAVWHHELEALADTRFLGLLHTAGFSIALHGSARDRQASFPPSTTPDLQVIAAGTFASASQVLTGATVVNSLPRFFNLLTLERNFRSVLVETYEHRSGDSMWRPASSRRLELYRP